MRGFLCDGGCGGFFTDQPAANYEHRAYVGDPDAGSLVRVDLDAQFCGDCAARITTEFGLYQRREVLRALEQAEEGQNA